MPDAVVGAGQTILTHSEMWTRPRQSLESREVPTSIKGQRVNILRFVVHIDPAKTLSSAVSVKRQALARPYANRHGGFISRQNVGPWGVFCLALV